MHREGGSIKYLVKVNLSVEEAEIERGPQGQPVGRRVLEAMQWSTGADERKLKDALDEVAEALNGFCSQLLYNPKVDVPPGNAVVGPQADPGHDGH